MLVGWTAGGLAAAAAAAAGVSGGGRELVGWAGREPRAPALSAPRRRPSVAAAQYGGAKYIPTGRGYAIKHNTFVKVRLAPCLPACLPRAALQRCASSGALGSGPAASRSLRIPRLALLTPRPKVLQPRPAPALALTLLLAPRSLHRPAL